MKLWGGRFIKPTNQLVHEFNASITFDKKLCHYDIQGSIAHVTMLSKQNILTKTEEQSIIDALQKIDQEIIEQTLAIDESYEDIHSFIEGTLIERIGDAGKKLHTGRSRNDQVALDMRLYTRDQILALHHLCFTLLTTIQNIMKEHTETFMPGFTHLQKAQPITLAHHMGAYFEMFKRDTSRLEDIYQRMNICPLGSGALAGTTYPLDRKYIATLLDFDDPCLNSIDGVSDRDYIIELLSALSTMMMHMSRLSEEIIIWNSDEYKFIELDDAFSTGSSIMPQKKNPDIAELIRGKTGRVYGTLMGILTTMKGLPLAYNKDMQEDKEGTFDAIETVQGCLQLLSDMLQTTTFLKDTMKQSASSGFTNATDAADYLVNNGVPFRDAHGIIGELVLYAIQQNTSLDALSLAEYQAISPVFKEDIYEAIALTTCVNKRNTIGAPSKQMMEQVITINDTYLKTLDNYFKQL
jgi:argininosuccinate lyase